MGEEEEEEAGVRDWRGRIQKKKKAPKLTLTLDEFGRETRVREPIADFPPEDPIRPQLDETRHSRPYPSRRRRSRSRSRERRAREDRSRSREREFRSREGQSKLRETRERSRKDRSSRKMSKWTHDKFLERSPSPIRPIDPFYKPPTETWVSRAGGVYLPRKPSEK